MVVRCQGECTGKWLRLTLAEMEEKEAALQTMTQQPEVGGQARELDPEF